MKCLNRILIAIIPVVLLAGCGTTPVQKDTAVTGVVSGADEAPVTTAIDMQEGFAGDPINDPDSLLAKRVIYFDFDRSTIKSEYRDILSAHGEYLASHPGVKITLEGHCDERGTREYNMALGERRAQAVSKVMKLMGVGSSQIDEVSFGEERPAVSGHDESAWMKNRRAEIIYHMER